MSPPMNFFMAIAVLWPRGSSASTTETGFRKLDVSVKRDEEFGSLTKEVRGLLEAARHDAVDDIRLRAEEALQTMTSAEKENQTLTMSHLVTQAALAEAIKHLGAEASTLPTWAQDNATSFIKTMMNNEKIDISNSRRLTSYVFTQQAATMSSHTDEELLQNCMNDPTFVILWAGTTCAKYNFVNCNPDAYLGNFFINVMYFISPTNYEMMAARCPLACGLCSQPNDSPNELLARCEDAPAYYTHNDTLTPNYGCNEMAGGFCEGILPSVWYEEHAVTMANAHCPRTCGACDKCAPGMHITSDLIPDSHPDFCVSCSNGTFSSEWDSASCNPCEAGHFASAPGSPVCDKCPLGTYQPSTGATACISCDIDSTGLWTTRLEMQLQGGESDFFEANGATSLNSCQCKEGYRMVNSACVKCGEGLVCNGRDHQFTVASGYYAKHDDNTSVYRCWDTPESCPEGLPGTCAFGRDANSILRGKCVSGYQPGSNGECEKCGGGDTVPFVLVVLLVIGALIAFYVTIAKENRARQKSSTVFITIALGLLVTVAQQLKVFAMLALEWPEPFKSVLSVMTIFGFNLSVLGLNCVGEFSPVVQFALNLVNIVILLGVIAVVHILYVVKEGKNSAHVHLLANCYGTIFMAFATAIASLTFAPFQCNDHPNGQRTMKGYPTTLCWEGGDHSAMLGIGILATLILLSCVASCVFIVSKFPAKMRQGDTQFLKGTTFLFSRFRVGSHFYSLICLFRGLMIALVPVLPNALTQCALFVVLLFYSTATMYVLPWRILHASFLDVGVTTALIMLLTLALFFAEAPNLILVSKFCCAIIGIAISSVVIGLGYGLVKKYVLKQKPFQYFLCHHKGGCGSFARLLKMNMTGDAKVTEKVFLDSDDLQDLNRLFDVVREDLGTLVVLCTKEVLMRPWCAGEITTARMNNVPVVTVIFPDFSFPDEDTIKNYGTLVPGTGSLAPHGIDEDMVQESLRWIKDQPSITYASDVSVNAVDDLVKAVVTNAAQKDTKIKIEVTRQMTGSQNKAVILTDLAYSEASDRSISFFALLFFVCVPGAASNV